MVRRTVCMWTVWGKCVNDIEQAPETGYPSVHWLALSCCCVQKTVWKRPQPFPFIASPEGLENRSVNGIHYCVFFISVYDTILYNVMIVESFNMFKLAVTSQTWHTPEPALSMGVMVEWEWFRSDGWMLHWITGLFILIQYPHPRPL